MNAALREAEFGNTATAKQDVAAALALAPGRDVKLLSALTLARVGDTARNYRRTGKELPIANGVEGLLAAGH